jgi:F-type H+-transporting ATPase subunit b
MPDRVLAVKIFIVPDFTLVWELLIFLIILAVMWRFVVPPVQRSMRERREEIKRGHDEAEKARQRLAESEAEYRRNMAELRSVATSIRAEAHSEGQRHIEAARTRAEEEYVTQAADAIARLDADRGSVLDELRGETGRLAATLAGRIVGEPLESTPTRSTAGSSAPGREGRR